MLSLCRQLSQIAPVCGVLGNHEDELELLDGVRELVEKFTAAGVTILRNSRGALYRPRQCHQHSGRGGQPEGLFTTDGASTFMDSVAPADRLPVPGHLFWHTFPPTFPSIWKIIPLNWVWPGTPTAGHCRLPTSPRFTVPRRAFCPTMPGAAIRSREPRHPHRKPGAGRFQPGAPHQQRAGTFGH